MVHDNGVKETTPERQKHKEDCSALALKEASKSAAGALVASVAGVGLANSFSPGFRRALGTSGKAALVVSVSEVRHISFSAGSLVTPLPRTLRLWYGQSNIAMDVDRDGSTIADRAMGGC